MKQRKRNVYLGAAVAGMLAAAGPAPATETTALPGTGVSITSSGEPLQVAVEPKSEVVVAQNTKDVCINVNGKDTCRAKDTCKSKDGKDLCMTKDTCKSADGKDTCKAKFSPTAYKDTCKSADGKDTCKAPTDAKVEPKSKDACSGKNKCNGR
jgi:hypothetical protein